MGKIEGAIRGTRVADVDAVEENLGLVRIGAADENRSEAAGAAGLHHIEARYIEKRIGQRAFLLGQQERSADLPPCS